MSLVPHKLEHKVPPSQPLLETQIGKIDDISGFDVDFLSLSLLQFGQFFIFCLYGERGREISCGVNSLTV